MIFVHKVNKFCYCRNRRRALWRKHSILLEKWIKQYKLGRIRQVAILNSPVVTSWRTESSNISLVVLDKLLYYSRNLIFFIFQNFLKTDQPTDRPTDRHQHVYRRIPSSKKTIIILHCTRCRNILSRWFRFGLSFSPTTYITLLFRLCRSADNQLSLKILTFKQYQQLIWKIFERKKCFDRFSSYLYSVEICFPIFHLLRIFGSILFSSGNFLP